MKDKKNRQSLQKEKEQQHKSAKIFYDVITPEDRDPQPKKYDEIEY